MARILKGDIFWANLNPALGNEQAAFRPVLVLSEDIFNQRSGTIIALAITSQKPKAGFPLTYPLSSPNLPKKSWVKISQIRTLSVKRVREYLSHVDPQELNIIIDGLNEIFGR